MTNQEIAKNLIELVGGKENIKSAQNCMTRCRLELFDYSKVQMEELKKSEGALGVVQAEGQLQIIYGPGKVNKVTEEVNKIVGKKVLLGDDAIKETKDKLKEKNNTKFKNAL
ncbi:MAG: PTS transporter subunit EIIB [Paraclostridium bifermentans]